MFVRNRLEATDEAHDKTLEPCQGNQGRLPSRSAGVGIPESNTSNEKSIHFSAYPFMQYPSFVGTGTAGALHLASEGCFSVPVKGILDEFLEKYFVHLHPMLPLLNERKFWDIYAIRFHGDQKNGNAISLLLLQAMLFVSCPVSTVRTVLEIDHLTNETRGSSFARNQSNSWDSITESRQVARSILKQRYFHLAAHIPIIVNTLGY